MREYPLWLICGMPCSGKTTFGNWLRDQKAFLHLDLESRDCLAANGLPQFWPERIWNLDEADLAEFVTYLRTLERGVALTWAFHPDLIPFVRQLAQSGIEGWWFEADRLAAREKFLARRMTIRHGVYVEADPDPAGFDRYFASLVAHWSEIGPNFGRRIIRSLDASGQYHASGGIYGQMVTSTNA